MIPRWLKRFLRRFGFNLTPKQEQESDDFYAQYEDADEPESPSDPPPLEDMSHLLALDSTENVAGLVAGAVDGGNGGGERGVGGGGDVGGVSVVEGSPSESSESFGSAGTTPSTLNACSSISQDSQTQPTGALPAKPESITRQSSQTKCKERYVYDPVYGVILQETRDLWHAQEEDSQHRKKALLDAFLTAEKPIPPVRFSTRELVS